MLSRMKCGLVKFVSAWLLACARLSTQAATSKPNIFLAHRGRLRAALELLRHRGGPMSLPYEQKASAGFQPLGLPVAFQQLDQASFVPAG